MNAVGFSGKRTEDANLQVADHGHLVRYECPVQRCQARAWWLVNGADDGHPWLPPYCEEESHGNRRPRMFLQATLGITDQLPWAVQDEVTESRRRHQAERGSGA